MTCYGFLFESVSKDQTEKRDPGNVGWIWSAVTFVEDDKSKAHTERPRNF